MASVVVGIPTSRRTTRRVQTDNATVERTRQEPVRPERARLELVRTARATFPLQPVRTGPARFNQKRRPTT